MKLSKIILVALVVTITVSTPAAVGSSAQSARSLGMANSYLTLSGNCEAALLNPANLALPGRPNYSIKLFSVSGKANNNAFSWSDYQRYNGAYLTAADKQDILGKIPTDGLSLDFTASASAFSFSIGALAVTTEVLGGGRGDLAKDPLELALMGNKVGELVTAAGSDATSWSAAAIGLSYGRTVYQNDNLILAAGATVKYLRGLLFYDVNELTAEAVTEVAGVSGGGGLTSLISEGGSGYAVDIGLALNDGRSDYALVIRNLTASINWNSEVEQTLYNFEFENLTLDNSDDDTIWISDETDLPGQSFSSRPPLEIEIGASRTFGRLLAAASLKQGFEKTAFVSKKPRLALGAEYPALSFLALRTGLAAGGVAGFSAAFGVGFAIGAVQFDAAYATAGTALPWGGKGGHVAIATILDF